MVLARCEWGRDDYSLNVTKIMPIITSSFRNPGSASLAFRECANHLRPVIDFLQGADPLSREWFLIRDSESESLLYTAFDFHGELTPAAEAVLETDFKGAESRYLAVWNGQGERGNGAGIAYLFHQEDWPSWSLEIDYQGDGLERLGGLDGVTKLVSLIATSLRPSYVNVARTQYFNKQVFQDRPGVGWMLYLPVILTVKQVPEARALVAVMEKDGKSKQVGTILVSVVDEPFSDLNPEHVKIANAIEIRLVDHDLLPRFPDM